MAKRRIIFASLYLGDGDMEGRLVQELEEKLQSSPGMQLGVLLDYFRGTRGGDKSSASMLQGLADKGEV